MRSFGAGRLILRSVAGLPVMPFLYSVVHLHSLAVTAEPSPDTRTQVAEKLSPLDVFHDKVKLRVVQKVAKPMYVRLQSRKF